LEQELNKAGVYGNSPMMKEARKLISSKCGGLPKVLLALGSYLANRPKDLLEQECRHLNANFMHELETNPEFGSLQGLLSWLRSYFNACPGPLKLCILYASIFPEDCVSRRRRLVRRWIAEGYSKGTDSNTMVEYAEKLFDKLASLSIISRSAQGKVTVSGCQINGFFREYITSRPTEQKIFFPLEVSVLEGEDSMTTERVGQHLAVGSSWERDKVVYESLDFLRLRSLTVFGGWQSFFISGRMRVLRVLDLENAQDVTDEDLEKIGRLLLRLKFLSLRRCKKIYYLPDSLGGLKQLQTLDIRHTSVVKLPTSIMKLRKLQYIRAGTTQLKDKEPPAARLGSRLGAFASSCFGLANSTSLTDVGVVVTRGIGKMTALHTLGVVNISAAGWGDILGGLKNLTQLRKLGVSGINQNNILEFSSAISRHAHLESLSVRGEKMPIGVMSLTNLKKLSLQMVTLLTQSEIEVLEKLKRLETLRLHTKKVEDDKLQFLVRQIGIDMIDPFPKIMVLDVACESSLEVVFDAGSMGKLELLKVDCSYGSLLKFSGLQDIISLKQVLVKGRCQDPLKEELEKQVAAHKNNPVWNMEELHSSS
jgi:Leucine-rich repeat (LRR) protein